MTCDAARSSHSSSSALWRAASVASALVAFTACGDPADFRPAKGAADWPSVPMAFRVKAAASDCESLGYVRAAGRSAINDIEATAARHGANTYVIHDDDTDERVTTVENNQLVTRTNHKYLAEVYRCPTSTDLPR